MTIGSDYLSIRRGIVPGPIREVLGALGDDGFIGGGAARWALNPLTEPAPSDIDVFLTSNSEHKGLQVSHRLADAGYQAAAGTGNAVTYRAEGRPLAVQVIRPLRALDGWPRVTYGVPTEVLEHFDFTVNAVVARYDRIYGYEFIVHPSFEDDRALRALRPIHIGNPVRFAARVVKYVQKGYTMAPEAWVSIFDAWKAGNEDSQAKARDAATKGGNSGA